MYKVYFLIFFLLSHCSFCQQTNKVYAGIEIGVSFNRFVQQLETLETRGELSSLREGNKKFYYTIEYHKGKPIYMYIGPGRASGTVMNKMAIVISPEAEQPNYLTNANLMTYELGKPDILEYSDVFNYIATKISEKYSSNFKQRYSQINHQNGEIVPINTLTWKTKNLEISLVYYGTGRLHRLVLNYELNGDAQKNRF